jgi:hypothetical protein
MVPVSKAPPFDVAVCAVLSLLTHVTVVPTATVTGFGEYAFVVRLLAPLTIVTVAPAPGAGVGVGVGEGVGVDELLPHAAMHIAARRIAPTRTDIMVTSGRTSRRLKGTYRANTLPACYRFLGLFRATQPADIFEISDRFQAA